MAHLTSEPPRIAALRPDVPEGLAVICRQMMAKKPEERFGSMREVAEALGAWLTSVAESQAKLSGRTPSIDAPRSKSTAETAVSGRTPPPDTQRTSSGSSIDLDRVAPRDSISARNSLSRSRSSGLVPVRYAQYLALQDSMQRICCQDCSAEFAAPTSTRGSQQPCPQCGKLIDIPA